MTGHDDFDRTLHDWLEAEAVSPAPAGELDRVLDATRRFRPRPAWLSDPGSRWVRGAPSTDLGTGAHWLGGLDLRWSTVVVVFLLVLAIAAGAVFVAGQLTRRPAPVVPGHLAYILHGAVYLADWDGRNPVRIGGSTSSGDGCEDAFLEFDLWSPNGRYLAYRSSHGSGCTPTVHIHDALGKEVASWAAGVGWNVAWAPDSRRVVAWDTDAHRIAIRGVDGVLQQQVTLPGDFCICGDHDPLWAHDGTAILIRMNRGGQFPTELWRVPISGGSPSRLGEGLDTSPVRGVAYSPDGATAAFWSDDHLVVARTAAMTVVLTAVDAAGISRPVWSPTGDRIALRTVRDQVFDQDGNVASETEDLQVLDLTDGQLATVATARGVSAIWPLAFSPDGDRILLEQDDPAGTTSLWSINTDGSDARELVPAADWGDWQPRPADP
jgi:Tol biopolymer transport system component